MVFSCFSKSSALNILILGFYDRGNTGDEMYKPAFKRLFHGQAVTLSFACTDDIKVLPSKVDVVICGGGDIINDYFMTKVKALLNGFTGRVYALSVGIPYAQCEYLHMFDHVFVRSRGDYDLACKEIGRRNVTRMHDLCRILLVPPPSPTSKEDDRALKLGVCLAQPQILENPALIGKLCAIFSKLGIMLSSDQSLEIHLIPFNLFIKNPNECDLLANAQLETALKAGGVVKVVNHRPKNADAVVKLAQSMKATLCMRYHSAIFSANPIVISESPKMKKWAEESDHVIRSVNLDLCRIIHSALCFPNESQIPKPLDIPIKLIHHILLSSSHQRSILVPTTQKIRHPLETVLKFAYETQNAHLIAFLVTGSVNHKFVWGLDIALQDKSRIHESVKYVYDNELKRLDLLAHTCPQREYCPNIQVNRKLGAFKMHPDLGLESYHRTGWPWVTKCMLNASCVSSENDPFFDPYVDKTFHWGRVCFETVGLIPYVKPWFGIIHHTFMEECGPFHSGNLFKTPSFLKSLECCIYLIALSEDLANKIRRAMHDLSIDGVPVYALMHPAAPVDDASCMWSLSKFMHSKTVVQIGEWMRDKDAIWSLEIPRQCVLKKKVIATTPSAGVAVCGTVASDLHSLRQNVEIIKYLSDQKYDELLASSVVFLKLLDASAVNTVLECLVRGTPIIVNRLPALEEVLGVDYPGFYDTLETASILVSSWSVLIHCHTHIMSIDKKKYEIDFFIRQIQQLCHRRR